VTSSDPVGLPTATARIDLHGTGRALLALARLLPAAERTTRTGSAGALADLRLGVKDAIRVDGLPTTYGTRVPDPVAPGPEAAAVGQLRRAGAVVAAKTNCGELCIGDYVLVGTPTNPAAPGRSVSGSSGGCASAVAARALDASLCSDTGGSARIPAAYCGVLGLKLTTGRVPMDGVLPLAPSLDALGVIASDLHALGLVLHALVGRSAAAHGPRYAVVSPGAATDATVAQALERLRSLSSVGGVDPPDLTGWAQLHRRVLGQEANDLHGHLAEDPQLGGAVRRFLRATESRASSCGTSDRIRAELDRILRRVDVVVLPAVDGPAPVRPPERDSASFWAELDWIAPINHTGHPALVLPVPGSSPPVALQLVARHGDEPTLLACAEEVHLVLARHVIGAGGSSR
jgi:Asp-tRNA(Asn)/Glu-tRNA(Gln) amidotransferase A subunit family amidase